MALSANTDWVVEDVEGLSTKAMIVLDAAVIYNGALCSHDTTVGAIKPYDGTDTDRLVGWHFGDAVTGDVSATPRPHARICPGGFVVRDLTVAAISDADTDFGLAVYASADGTYSITPVTTDVRVGYIVASPRARTAGKADVYFENVFARVGA